MAKLVIFGIGDFARLAHHYFTRDTNHEVVAFTVDPAYRQVGTYQGLRLISFDEIQRQCPPDEFLMFVAIGYTRMNQLRGERCTQARELGYTLVSYVSSRCSVLTDEPIGDNCFLLENATVQPFARIGDGVILWAASCVAHDSIVEDYCYLAPGAVVSGFTRVGAYSFIGANAAVGDHVDVAPRTLIGAGAAVTKATCESGVYVPSRAVLLPKRSDEITL